MTAPLIYLSRFDLDPGFVARYEEWYERRHAPDLLGIGFLAVAAYVAVAGPGVCNVYEVPGLDAFGPAYEEVTAADSFRSQLSENVQHGARVVLEQVETRGVQAEARIAAPAIVVLDVDRGADDHGVVRWFEAEVGARLAALPEFVGVRLGRAVDAPVATPDGPGWYVVSEWATGEAATGAVPAGATFGLRACYS